jgi:hypothetical protein
MPASLANMSVLTVLRATIIALLALIGMFFPGVVPDDMVEAMADRVVQVVAGVFWLWMAAIAWRLKRQNEGKEVT